MVLPIDLVNEQIVLAAALTNEPVRLKLLGLVQADLFVEDQHAAIWGALVDLSRRGLVVDTSALAQALAGRVEASYIADLMAAYPSTPGNLDHHVSALRWDHARASAARGPLADLLKLLQDPASEPIKVRAAGKQVAIALDVVVDRSYLSDAKDLARRSTEELLKRGTAGIVGYGIQDLDFHPDGSHRMLVGTARKAITVVTGVSGSNKSTLTARIVLEQARMQRTCLYGAWEMTKERTLELLAVISLADQFPDDPCWTRYSAKVGRYDAAHVKAFQTRCEQIGEFVKFFDPPFHRELRKRYDNQDSLDVLSQNIQDSGAEVVVMDLLDRALPSSKPEDMERALYRIQQIAIETDSHLMPLVQQKLKEVEESDDKMPTRRTIFGSQAWVTVADTILGVHYPRLWKPTLSESKLEILVLKQREGRWPLRVEFDWDPDRVRLSNGNEMRMQYDPENTDDAKVAVQSFLGKGKTPAYTRNADKKRGAR